MENLHTITFIRSGGRMEELETIRKMLQEEKVKSSSLEVRVKQATEYCEFIERDDKELTTRDKLFIQTVLQYLRGD